MTKRLITFEDEELDRLLDHWYDSLKQINEADEEDEALADKLRAARLK